MTYTSLKRTQTQTDLLAVDLLAECPNCSELCPVGATVCECGTHLFVRQSNGVGRNSLDGMRAADAEEVNDTVSASSIPHSADCPCNRCYLEELEGDPFVRDTARALEIVTRPANVTPIRPAPQSLTEADFPRMNGSVKA